MTFRPSARVHVSRGARSSAIASTAVLAALTLACSSHDKPAGGDTTTAVAEGIAPDNATAASARGTVHLVVSSGPHAGTYDAQMKDGGCSYGLAGTGAWGNQYSTDTKDVKAFSSLQLVVPNAKAAASGTAEFELTAGFGPIFGSGATSYDVDTRANSSMKRGSGTVTVEDHGTTGKVTFDAKTADGVELEGTIDCSAVMRAS